MILSFAYEAVNFGTAPSPDDARDEQHHQKDNAWYREYEPLVAVIWVLVVYFIPISKTAFRAYIAVSAFTRPINMVDSVVLHFDSARFAIFWID